MIVVGETAVLMTNQLFLIDEWWTETAVFATIAWGLIPRLQSRQGVHALPGPGQHHFTMSGKKSFSTLCHSYAPTSGWAKRPFPPPPPGD
jgi:hypothetical protein